MNSTELPIHPMAGVADGCEHVYLDLGSNIGVQVRKLFEPEAYPEAPLRRIFEEMFGPEGPQRSARVCAFGFEPNPRLTTRLRKT
jgi:hypothetical protein